MDLGALYEKCMGLGRRVYNGGMVLLPLLVAWLLVRRLCVRNRLVSTVLDLYVTCIAVLYVV